jgi:hypothetical protein
MRSRTRARAVSASVAISGNGIAAGPGVLVGADSTTGADGALGAAWLCSAGAPASIAIITPRASKFRNFPQDSIRIRYWLRVLERRRAPLSSKYAALFGTPITGLTIASHLQNNLSSSVM